MSLNSEGPLSADFFQEMYWKHFLEICDNWKNSQAEKPRNIKKIKEKVCHECTKYMQILVYFITY